MFFLSILIFGAAALWDSTWAELLTPTTCVSQHDYMLAETKVTKCEDQQRRFTQAVLISLKPFTQGRQNERKTKKQKKTIKQRDKNLMFDPQNSEI